jgi:hypothetical protein
VQWGPWKTYDTLGAKVDLLSEADLMDELEKIATMKTSAEVQAEDHYTMKNITDIRDAECVATRPRGGEAL